MSHIAKRCRVGDNDDIEEDRISNLPVHLISSILGHIPINDAARTSILSKTWKNIWQNRMYLVLRKPFFDELVSKRDVQAHQSVLSEAVNTILLAHKGPLLGFYFWAPRGKINKWMSLLSTKRVKYLELVNAKPFGCMSPYLFFCSELVELGLSGWSINPPPNFGGFRNLNSVALLNVKLDADMSFGPQLIRLRLVECLGVQHLRCQFTHDNKNLTELILLRSEFSEKECAFVQRNDPMSSMKEYINLQRLLSCTPKLSTLVLNGFSLGFLDPDQAILTRLATTMVNLKTLELHKVEFYDLRQISNVLCLIRSSPNLQTLKISGEHEVKSMNPVGTEDYITIGILQHLRTVEIRGAVGSRAELSFLRYLLAASSSLRLMSVWVNTSIINDPKQELEIALQLLRFPRISKVELVWGGYKY